MGMALVVPKAFVDYLFETINNSKTPAMYFRRGNHIYTQILRLFTWVHG